MTQKTITRADLSRIIYEDLKIPRHESALIIDAFFEEITKVLSNDEVVKIAGFGSFNLSYKKARVGRNPKTGLEVVITPRTVVSFSPSKTLREKVNKLKIDKSDLS